MHITESPNIVYDSEIINNMKEILNEEYEKLKSFDNIESSKLYSELEEKFNDIANNLETCEFFYDELEYFLLITDQILYITYQNCSISFFRTL